MVKGDDPKTLKPGVRQQALALAMFSKRVYMGKARDDIGYDRRWRDWNTKAGEGN